MLVGVRGGVVAQVADGRPPAVWDGRVVPPAVVNEGDVAAAALSVLGERYVGQGRQDGYSHVYQCISSSVDLVEVPGREGSVMMRNAGGEEGEQEAAEMNTRQRKEMKDETRTT